MSAAAVSVRAALKARFPQLSRKGDESASSIVASSAAAAAAVNTLSNTGQSRSHFLSAKLPPTLFRDISCAIREPWPRGPLAPYYYLFSHEQKSPTTTLDSTRNPHRGVPRQMLTWVQVLSTPTADTPGACLLLHFENRRYLFGHLAEGTQRLTTQRKLALSKVEEIFLTGPIGWNNAGGLLGMILTIADVVTEQRAMQVANNEKRKAKNKPLVSNIISSLKIRGGENLTYLLATARRFIFRKGFPLKPLDITTDPRSTTPEDITPDWQDANIQVWYVPLTSTEPRKEPSRKRSYDMISDPEEGEADDVVPAAEKAGIDRQIVESVVTNMFDSDWQMDALVETTLHKAKLPATLFVKDEDGHIKKYEGPMPGGVVQVPDIPVLVRRPWPGARVLSLPRSSPSQQSLCYIVKTQPRRGKFNVEQAQKLGVKREDYKVLTRGEAVTSKDGQIVTPDMVVGESIEGRGFAIVDIPNASYIEAFLARPEWSNSQIINSLDAFYWTLGSGLIQDSRIQDFMKQHSSMRHTVFSTDVCPNILAIGSPAAETIKRNRIDPDRYPLLNFNNQPQVTSETEQTYQAAQAGETLQIAPRLLFQDDKAVPLFDSKEPYEDVADDVLALRDAARAKITPEYLAKIEELEKDIPNRDAEVIPLGTGSALPSKYRNVSATLVRVPGYGSYLFDCGENTLGQIRRMYGYEGANEVLRDLKVLWISHLHADHHLGTASVIRAWRDATAASEIHKDARLAVASHANMLDWLREYADVEDYGFDRIRQIQLHCANESNAVCPPVRFEGAERDAFGLMSIEACRVDHCYGALACVFTWPSGLKIAFSGDCRPSRTFAELGKGATLLIHESTLDDELSGDALAKKHCTMSEALGVARDMDARRVLLTHFSQRYPKIPVIGSDSEENGVQDHQVVLMAFDHMRVKLGEFKQAELFLPALRKLLEKEDEKQ